MKIVGTEAPSHAVDMMVEDGANAARANGAEVRPGEIRAYVQGIVEKLDRKRADQKPTPKPQRKPEPDVDRLLWVANRNRDRKMTPAEWTIKKGGDTPESPLLTSHKLRQQFRARKALLYADPVYRAELQTVAAMLALARRGKSDRSKTIRDRAYQRLYALLEKSDKHWGPWWKEQPKPLLFI